MHRAQVLQLRQSLQVSVLHLDIFTVVDYRTDIFGVSSQTLIFHQRLLQRNMHLRFIRGIFGLKRVVLWCEKVSAISLDPVNEAFPSFRNFPFPESQIFAFSCEFCQSFVLLNVLENRDKRFDDLVLNFNLRLAHLRSKPQQLD